MERGRWLYKKAAEDLDRGPTKTNLAGRQKDFKFQVRDLNHFAFHIIASSAINNYMTTTNNELIIINKH